MPDILLSGPAGAQKSRQAAMIREAAAGLAIIADFQAIYAALTGDQRGPDGRYPLRDERLLPVVEYVRRAAITGAAGREIQTIATNSDGDPERRQFLLSQLRPGAVEKVIDPGRDVVVARLSEVDPSNGRLVLSSQCEAAVERWYSRI